MNRTVSVFIPARGTPPPKYAFIGYEETGQYWPAEVRQVQVLDVPPNVQDAVLELILSETIRRRGGFSMPVRWQVVLELAKTLDIVLPEGQPRSLPGRLSMWFSKGWSW
ncbi:MAG: hypothetical protein AB7T74_03075 [Clostridia bacterium]